MTYIKNILYHDDIMREIIEIRISEDKAKKYLRSDEGEILGDTVRKIVLPFTDERVGYIGEIDKSMRAQGRAFFGSWNITRTYTQKELETAELFLMRIKKVFEPAGDECGTLYDETDACPRCGLNRRQTNKLVLDVKKLSKSIDIAKTIAGEVIVSSRFVESWKKNQLEDATFKPVLQKGKMPVITKDWYEPVVESAPLSVVKPTKAGNDPFDDDEKGQYKCPGHVLGLNLISELTVARKSYDGSDLVTTDLAFGWKQGLLMPERPLILSQKAWDCLRKDGIKGFNVEVVHLH